MNFAVFCSGHGTNLQAIIDAAKKRRISAKLAHVVIVDLIRTLEAGFGEKAAQIAVIILHRLHATAFLNL